MIQLKIETINDTLGITFSPEMIQELNLKEGDTIDVIKTPEGIQLTIHDTEFEVVMEAAQRVTNRYQNALRELAK